MEIVDELLVTCSGGRALRIWEVQSGKLRLTVPMPRTVSCLASMPGGKWILTGHHREMVSLWDLDSGQCVAQYVNPAKDIPAHRVWCSSDGSLIAATGTKGEVSLWRTLPDESASTETPGKNALGWPLKKPPPKAEP